MAYPLHEVGFQFLGPELSAMGGIPLKKRLVTISVDYNCMHNDLGSIYTPDLAVSFKLMKKLEDGSRPLPRSVMGETALSQDEEELDDKFKFEVASNPDLDMVIKLVIEESTDYRSPASVTSEAFQSLLAPIFAQEASKLTYPQLITQYLSASTFTQMMDPLAVPSIVVAGHTWCSIKTVRFHVWVRGNHAIDLDAKDGDHVAHGTLFPKIDMGGVDAMIARGISRMRDRLASLCEQLDPHFDASPMRQSNIVFPLELEWDHCRDSFLNAAEETAHMRYKAWYGKEVKRRCLSDDSNYAPVDSGSASEGDGACDGAPFTATRLRKKQRTDGEIIAV
ncbi:hypothetical protein EV702DRAFT_1202765 [Suillus placidus]|uniref:Uncharacterized protein n=1 Tax=Suillus placidus TaxID=48579 RepID=A0A9P6ZKV1_9AGAM|nr:hypothetical protein EV702DRAFT_1202765 [Suillus placidus]